MTGVHRYGLLPDVHDERDFRFSALRFHVPVLPAFLDHRSYAPTILNQGDLGACTGFGETRADVLAHALAGKAVPGPLSPLWLYWQERWLEHTVGEDVGAMPRDGLRVLRKVGCAPEADWPYDPARFQAHPPADLSAAAPAKISGFYRCHSLLEVKAALVAKHGVVMGFRVFESFEAAGVAQTGLMHVPTPGEAFLGGHCVAIEGYDDATHELLCANSWGIDWGAKGYFFMPYDYLDPTRGLVSDLWALVA